MAILLAFSRVARTAQVSARPLDLLHQLTLLYLPACSYDRALPHGDVKSWRSRWDFLV